jgi:hypothetical protein
LFVSKADYEGTATLNTIVVDKQQVVLQLEMASQEGTGGAAKGLAREVCVKQPGKYSSISVTVLKMLVGEAIT